MSEKKDLQSFATKLTEKKIPDPSTAREYSNSYLKRKKPHKISYYGTSKNFT